jgi:hypothetical protein
VSGYQFGPSFNPCITNPTADFNGTNESSVQNDKLSESSQQQLRENRDVHIFYDRKLIRQDQSDPNMANSPESLLM